MALVGRRLTAYASKLLVVLIELGGSLPSFEITHGELATASGIKHGWIPNLLAELRRERCIEDAGKSRYRVLGIPRTNPQALVGLRRPGHQSSHGTHGTMGATENIKTLRDDLSNGRSGPPKGGPRAREAARALAPHVVWALIARAARTLGIACAPTSDYGKIIQRAQAKRVTEGATPDQLLEVCRYAVSRWDNGDHWPKLRDLAYLWGKGFPALLAAATAAPGSRFTHRTGDDMHEWTEQNTAGAILPSVESLTGRKEPRA